MALERALLDRSRARRRLGLVARAARDAQQDQKEERSPYAPGR
jgi:hypothetical protein